MNNEKQYEENCRQLGGLLLRVDGTTRSICSGIKECGSRSATDFNLSYFDTADETGESKYRIFFGITEI
jgi:hypothetical protein